MDIDRMMIYIKSNPDCSISELADKFNVSLTRVASEANKIAKTGWLIKNEIRSPMNNKMIIGYRVHPDWNSVSDNSDGSMKVPHLLRILRIQHNHGSKELAYLLVKAHNDWRRANKQPLISMLEVTQ
jgi:hypothetical protein